MASVTFSASVGGTGLVVTDDSSGVTGLGNGGHLLRFVPCLQNVVAIAQYIATTAAGMAVQTSALFQDQKAYNVGGGTSVINANTRASLNTTVYNTIAGASLSGGQVVLANAGTYAIDIEAAGSCSGGTILQLLTTNTVGGATVQTDLGVTNISGSQGVTTVLSAKVTITQSATLVIKHWLSNAVGTTGLGVAHNFSGVNNTYLQVKIRRI